MKINKLLKKVDVILLESSKDMNSPIIDDDLGVLIYFATRYKISGKKKYKKHSTNLFNKFISIFNDYEFSTGLLTGFEGVFWVVTYIEECNIIEDSKPFLEDIENSLFLSIENDIKENRYEIFYGSIGKVQFLLNPIRIKEAKVIKLINNLIYALGKTKKERNGQFYWVDKEYEEHLDFVDLGLAHGICSILLFLVKLKELQFSNKHIDSLINGIIETYMHAENDVIGSSLLPDRYCIKDKSLNLIDSRLGFCVGDLPAAYAICYAGQILKKEDWIKFSKKIMQISSTREVSSSRLTQFSEYDFFDIGFCHGISSILYMFYRINKWLEDDSITFKVDYWKKELATNVSKFIKIKEPIYYTNRHVEGEVKAELNKNSFMDGLCGASLTLLAVEYNEISWSKFLSLY